MQIQRGAISPRTRFDIFKRDSFTCRYCGQASPAVVLEVDHVVPVAEGGSSDPINLVTSCFSCNRGKGAVPLGVVLDGEDPHERAVLLLERDRQVREYNAVLKQIRENREEEADELEDLWKVMSGRAMTRKDYRAIINRMEETPAEVIRDAMEVAFANGRTTGLAYVFAVLNNRKVAQRGVA